MRRLSYLLANAALCICLLYTAFALATVPAKAAATAACPCEYFEGEDGLALLSYTCATQWGYTGGAEVFSCDSQTLCFYCYDEWNFPHGPFCGGCS